MNGYLEWLFAIRCKRLALVAAGGDFWTDCLELYAFESQHLWSAVSPSTFNTRVRV